MALDFMKSNNWVVVGDVLNSSKYAFKILNALKGKDFNVEGVNPRAKNDTVYKSLSEVPYKIDVIDLCINPIDGLKVMKEAKEMNINKVLIQPGAGSTEILNFCKESGIIAVEGCALIELSRL